MTALKTKEYEVQCPSCLGKGIVKQLAVLGEDDKELVCICNPNALEGSWFGPCADGKNHQSICPIGRATMKAAKWPCGAPIYPGMQDA